MVGLAFRNSAPGALQHMSAVVDACVCSLAPACLTSIRHHLELLAAIQPHAVDVHLERDEASDCELVQPGVIHTEDAGRALRGHPVRRQVVEMVAPRVDLAGQRLDFRAGQAARHTLHRRTEGGRP